MYKLNLKYADSILYSKDVIIGNDERLHDIINKFVRDNVHEIKIVYQNQMITIILIVYYQLKINYHFSFT